MKLLASLILILAACIPPEDSPPDAQSEGSRPITVQIAAAGATLGSDVIYLEDRTVRAVKPGARVHVSLPVLDRSCLLSVQVTERPGVEPSLLTLFGQEEDVTFLDDSVESTDGGAAAWTRTVLRLEPPHEVIDESAYTVEWAGGLDGVLGQVQFTYRPGPGC